MVLTEPSLRYLVRMATVLSDYKQIGISNLAMLARVNHKRCAANLDWMEQHGYVKLFRVERRKEVAATDKGIEYIRKILSLPLPLCSFVAGLMWVCTLAVDLLE